MTTRPKPNLRPIPNSDFPSFETGDFDARFLQYSWNRPRGDSHSGIREDRDQENGISGRGVVVVAITIVAAVLLVIGMRCYDLRTRNSTTLISDKERQSNEFFGTLRKAEEDVESSMLKAGIELGVLVVIAVITPVLLVIGRCCYDLWTRNSTARIANEERQSEEFFDAFRKAKEDVESSVLKEGIERTAGGLDNNLGAEPRSGMYRAKYREGPEDRERTVTLNFRREEGGGGYYVLSGTTTNGSSGGGGSTIIEDGRSSYEGTAWRVEVKDGRSSRTGTAWWRKVYQQESEACRRTLSVGKFDFEAGTFSGERKPVLGYGGRYISFEAVEHA